MPPEKVVVFWEEIGSAAGANARVCARLMACRLAASNRCFQVENVRLRIALRCARIARFHAQAVRALRG
jgi:hypothetical protein